MAKGVKGKFITFEGSEGSGKSTQIGLIHRELKRRKRPVLFVREPGGVKISEDIRAILLDVKSKGMTKVCETLLYMAARSQLVGEVIAPALKGGKIVLCDRFLDSTLAYQGYGNGVDIGLIKNIGRLVTEGVTPDLTVVFDIDAAAGLRRIKRAKDRIERRSLAYHNRVRRGYLQIAKEEPRRVQVIKVSGRTREDIQAEVRAYVDRIV